MEKIEETVSEITTSRNNEPLQAVPPVIEEPKKEMTEEEKAFLESNEKQMKMYESAFANTLSEVMGGKQWSTT